MGRLLFIALFLSAVPVSPATYFVKNGGDDTKTGLDSTTNVWETMFKACTTLVAGDTLWVMGGKYDENNNYGTSINGTMRPSNSGTSTDTIVYIGHSDYSVPQIYGDSGVCDRQHLALADKDYLKFKNLEFSNGYKGVLMSGNNHIYFEDCVSRHNLSGTAGAPEWGDQNGGGWVLGWSGSLNRNITWKRCTTYDSFFAPLIDSVGDQNISGWHIYKCFDCLVDSCTSSGQNKEDGFSSSGQGVFFKVNAYRFTVRYSTFTGGWTGIRIGDGSDTTASYVAEGEDSAAILDLHHNTIYDNYYGIYIRPSNEQSYADAYDSVMIYNNTIYHAPYGGIGCERWDNDGIDEIYSGVYIFNNIVMNAGVSENDNIWFDSSARIEDYYFDYNCYYNSGGNGSAIGTWNGAAVDLDLTLAVWKDSTNQDANAVNVYPVFSDTAGNDFALTASSPTSVRDGGRGGSWSTYMGSSEPENATVIRVSKSVQISKKVKIE